MLSQVATVCDSHFLTATVSHNSSILPSFSLRVCVHVAHQACASLPWMLFQDFCAVTKTSHSFLPCLPPLIRCSHHHQSAASYLTYFFHPSPLPSAMKTIGHPQVGIKRVGIKCAVLSRNEPDFIATVLAGCGWHFIMCLFCYLQ